MAKIWPMESQYTDHTLYLPIWTYSCQSLPPSTLWVHFFAALRIRCFLYWHSFFLELQRIQWTKSKTAWEKFWKLKGDFRLFLTFLGRFFTKHKKFSRIFMHHFQRSYETRLFFPFNYHAHIIKATISLMNTQDFFTNYR